MKLFGGKSPRQNSGRKRSASNGGTAGGAHLDTGGSRFAEPSIPPAPKEPGKAALKKRRSRRRALVVLLSVVLVFLCACGLLKSFIRPPGAVKPPLSGNNPGGIGDPDDDPDDEGMPDVEESGRERKEEYFTMVVACTDRVGANTDAMIVVSFDVKNMAVHMMNIPRDTMSNVSRANRKINAAYAAGKEKQMKKELTMLLGIPIDRYVIFDFKAVAKMVDAIGGVTYDVPVNMNYDDPTQNLHIHLKKGEKKLTGEEAVGMLRFRKNNDGTGYPRGDIQRIENLQSFIKALAKKMLTPATIPKIPALTQALMDNTKTDLSLTEMAWFGLNGVKIDLSDIDTVTLPGYDKYVYEPKLGGSRSYWIPQGIEEILAIVNEKFNPYAEDIKKVDIVTSKTISRGSAPASTPVEAPSAKPEEDPLPEESIGHETGQTPESPSGPGGEALPSEPGQEAPPDGGNGQDPPDETEPPESGGAGDETEAPEEEEEGGSPVIPA